jgi:hypothetical protein
MDVNATGTFLDCREDDWKHWLDCQHFVDLWQYRCGRCRCLYAASKVAVRLLTKGVALYCAANWIVRDTEHVDLIASGLDEPATYGCARQRANAFARLQGN